MICDACKATNEETRTCPICAECNCRHNARKGQYAFDGKKQIGIVCADSFACLVRHGERMIRQ